MANPRSYKLETATARLRLPPRKKPYWLVVSPNIAVGYRRNQGAGTWSVRRTGDGTEWVKKLGLADDFEKADGKIVLTYWEAIDVARKLARRQPGDVSEDDSRPVTVGEALTAYETDLTARGGDPYNARRARAHVPAALAAKPVSLLSASELIRWRDSLIGKGLARDTVNRVRTCVRAALSLAAKRDRRIVNMRVWQDDLDALPNATEARNVVLADAVVGKLIAAATARDRQLGLLVQVLAETGGRPSQVVRLIVGDLDAEAARLLMPRSGKGHAHKRVAKMVERVPVPITPELAIQLKQEVKGRPAHAPLLTRSDGTPWGFRRNDQYRDDVRAAVTAIGHDPNTTTLYCLRHSAISRMLLRGVPVTVCADLADTSEGVIRRHYAKLIAHHADEIARKGLLQIEAPAEVIPLHAKAGRRTI
jgi:integrase